MENQQDSQPSTHPRVPSPRAQSWGALLSIVVIVLMIIIGAFYAWDKRLSQNDAYPVPTAAN